ncbi:MAG: bifunctional methionine sulfoxide reductase B/A protein [Candidatus Eisenbacteria bacterium]|nr:bifunctional methionine sulfoxide reductase B/A protein [Candidatus Eisenbacteria bacterium]
MRRFFVITIALAAPLLLLAACGEQEIEMTQTRDAASAAETEEYRDLTHEEERVIVDKGTEMPFTGEYVDHFESGTYHCKRCDAPLYRSTDKFKTSCGWPSFDDEIEGAVRRERDADGIRTEILCANCGAHLGHVFEGERLTDTNIRHCVNSISLVFRSDSEANAEAENTKKAYFAGGCFWGVEHLFEQKEGVISASSGYMGGSVEDPSYRQVVSGGTGHLETVEVEYDPEKVSYEDLAKYFFEIHDPTQEGGQGPDIGPQYISAVFYSTEDEKKTAERLIGILKDKGYDVVTDVRPAGEFWEAEGYHQDYYEQKGTQPYCHAYTKRF